MNERKLHTNSELESWLSQNGPFEDCYIIHLEPLPRDEGSPTPPNVTIEIAYQIEGDNKAHSKRVSRVFRLSASGIQRYSFTEDGQYFPEHCSEGIDVLDDCSVIGLQIDVPSRLTLVCSSVVVQELPHLVETVEPWLSELEVNAVVHNSAIPSPQHWIDWFKDLGLFLAWHTYGGDLNRPEDVPKSDYQGWYLQNPEELDYDHQGIFFYSIKPVGTGFSVQIQNHGASPRLWLAAEKIFGQFVNATIRCGNCEFGPENWLTEITKSRLA
jgi:hypothetical protein